MKKSQPNLKNRRAFLSDCGKMTAVGAMSSVLNLSMTNKVLAARSPGSITDYKGLVCVYLAGGMDSFQMLMPGIKDFPTYTARRRNLALSRGAQHHIVDHRDSDRDNHVHRDMPEVRDMFNDRDLAFLSNVGTLVEPMTREQFANETRERPFGLASHNDQMAQWQTSIPNERGGVQGWFGRMADIISDAANNNATVSMNLSPGGTNILQQGADTSLANVRGGANALERYAGLARIRNSMNSQLEHNYSSLIQRHYNAVKKDAIDQNQALQDLERNAVINTVFPNTGLGQQLRLVAKYIKVHGVLGLNRQTFYVESGGWDMHQDIRGIGARFREISQCLDAFNRAMKEIGEHDNVVTYTASDFGRSLVGNGNGTDHAWGGNQIVMGGPVKGQRVLGAYPDLSANSSTNLNTRGRQLPTTSIDAYHATLALWFGVNNDSELEEIFPNIRNFYSRNENRHPIHGMFG